jgi:large subunit ribosomal protein L35Ae
MVKAIVLQFRRGKKSYTPRHFLIEVEGCDSREKAKKYIGHNVEWISPGKEKKAIKGKVSSAHGNKGVLRAIFERGLPGQAIGTDLKFLEGAKK